ncbi:molecular chaperone TorD family protein [Methylobacterium sp. SD274]|uniref:TorD/DmsD family molecular chaperone n=1 Tax=Methylobacterium sp. SD274 TaxID=2782009 RepID=UPI001A960FAD|nr:molecular chaperone TorD family protein [Methylobacterium sp. SD274]MBO1021728.1 molecular chaperone TorD family protein [Methylobacterium sp. SD274]
MRSVELLREDEAKLASGAPGMTQPVVDDVDFLRAHLYDLLAALTGRVPSDDILSLLAGSGGDETPLGKASSALAREAAGADLAKVGREYFGLFVGVGRGEVVPHASYYLTGFLNERPLARIRQDLARLGIEASGGMSEPEDHVAMLLETMAGLVSGRFETGAGEDRVFFERHLKPWAGRLFDDVAANTRSSFYRAVGDLGRTFIDIETRAYALDA